MCESGALSKIFLSTGAGFAQNEQKAVLCWWYVPPPPALMHALEARKSPPSLECGGGFYSILSKSAWVTVLLSVLQFQQAILGRVLLLPYGKP